jgi:putative endonuclease
MTQARRLLGAAGESAAAAWYEARGYEVVASNWRCRAGELDLVVRRGRTLAFVEVKTRSSDRFGLPAEAVTPVKQRRIRILAARFLDELDWHAAVIRFDVVSVLAGRLEVIESAF